MLLVVLLWWIGLVATFKEAVINLNSQINNHIQVLEILMNH